MEAKNYQLQNILNGSRQFMVPIYQRQYSWRDQEWKQLWSDITDLLVEHEGEHHFLGSIVSKSFDATAGGITRFLLIDGQQRLTTLTLLIAAIRDALRDQEDAESQMLARKLQDLYLTNQYETGNDYYKVLPTKADRDSYAAVIDSEHHNADEKSLIWSAYLWFCKQIMAIDNGRNNAELGVLVNNLVSNVEIVSITLSEDDNDYRIFESLNATGTPLTQTDLLRNFFLMRFDGNDQERVYHHIVHPMTSELNDVPKASSDTMFQYALQRTGVYVRDKDVYSGWKRRCDGLDIEELENVLLTIHRDSVFYLSMVEPSREHDSAVSERLRRLRQFGVLTPSPFVLNAMRWRDEGKIDSAGLARILHVIQSFLVRRMFCNVPTNALNRIFIRLAEQLPEHDDLVSATHHALSDPGRRWPSDDEFKEKFVTYRLYRDSRGPQRRVVLEALEAAAGNKESPALADLQIEHIMPQQLTAVWHEELGEEALQIHAKYLDTVGNLTLTGYNPELGNLPFGEKRRRYRDSNVQITKQVAEYDTWDDDSIRDRAEKLFRVAKEVWIGPVSDDSDQ
jgi:hypothetical protein